MQNVRHKFYFKGINLLNGISFAINLLPKKQLFQVLEHYFLIVNLATSLVFFFWYK